MNVLKIMLSLHLLLIGITGFSQHQQYTYRLPDYTRFSLQNGLTVYLMEQHEVPMIYVSVVVPAGAIYDSIRSGLANLTASALMFGTKTRTKAQLEESIDYRGASVNTYATKEYAGLNAGFAAKDADSLLTIISDILLHPSFNEKEYQKGKMLQIADLEQEKESPRKVINNFFDALYFGKHVYANPVAGRVSTVEKLDPLRSKLFYEKNYVPNASAIAIVGDFSSNEMAGKIKALFANWKMSQAPVNLASLQVTKPQKPRVLLVNKEDATETTFFIGGAGVSRNNPDYVAIEVVNTALGGRFTSWLNDELRVNTGLTYGAGSSFSRYKNAGTFKISTFTATKNTEAAITKAIEVLNKLHSVGLDEETLNSAKNYVKGGFPPKFETSEQLAGLLTQMFWFGFDENFINSFQQKVDELTVAGARNIIKKYFPAENLQFVLIGRSADIRDIASKFGSVKEANIKDDFLK